MYFALNDQGQPNHVDFWEYVDKKGVDHNTFIGFEFKNKEEIFLRWKWGFSVHGSNVDCEMTRRSLVRDMVMLDPNKFKDQDVQKYWSGVVRFEEKCRQIKTEIGLIYDKGVAQNPEVKKLTEMVGGKVTGVKYRR